MTIFENLNHVQKENITLSNHVIVTDPCYDTQTWCQIKLDNVKPGTYTTHSFQDKDVYARPNLIAVWHEDVIPDYNNLIELEGTVGVDSGEAGIADFDYYAEKRNGKDSSDWYETIFENLTVTAKRPLTNITRALCRQLADKYVELKQAMAAKEDWKPIHDHIIAIERKLERQYFIHTPRLDLKRGYSLVETYQSTTMDGKALFGTTKHGDGSYPCYVKYNDQKEIVGIVIDYNDVLGLCEK